MSTLPDFPSSKLPPEETTSVDAPQQLSEEQHDADQPLFQSFSQPEVVLPSRTPHLGHLALLSAFGAVGFLCGSVLLLIGMYFHTFGVTTLDQVKTNADYILGDEVVLYLIAFILSVTLFPLLWKKSFLVGIHWRGDVALGLSWRLPTVAVGCFGLAALDQWLLPGPSHAPIEDIFRSPGAAWLMFAFGVTFAPFFEEMAFRGFLLPALATACDWVGERIHSTLPRSLDADGHPQWSMPAMVIASVLTSLPFALVHVEQQGHSLGPFILLIVVSLILCAVRLYTRSLAASTLVHASYNFLLFSLMAIGSDGFRHLDKM
jgi:hypothetical protein